MRAAVERNGGKVIGSLRHPLGTTDFSSYIMQAQASNADVVAILNGGDDTINAVKTAKVLLILLPENNLKNACVVAQRLREQIAAQDLLPTPPINATVVLGSRKPIQK